MAKTCFVCGKPLPKGKHKYCSYPCYYAERHDKYYGNLGGRKSLSIQGKDLCATGAISELRVAADLLSKGYDVFRSVSPTSCLDLVAMKGQCTIKIEVRTAHENPITGHLYKKKDKTDNAEVIDMYAWVLSRCIIYEPELPPQQPA